MNVALVTFGRKGTRKDFALENGPLVIGRKIDADLRIPVAEVSRAHCRIMVDEDEVTLRDLGSSNGTFVNGEKVTETDLEAGDLIVVGPVTFTLQIDGVPQQIKPTPPVAKPEAKPEAVTQPAVVGESAADSGAFDIDEIGELDLDDLSDLDLGDLGDEDSGDIEEIDNLEEIDEADLIPDEEPKGKPAS